MEERVWILDTSSIIQLRSIVGGSLIPSVLKALDKQIEKNCLRFPESVIDELQNFEDKSDVFRNWSTKHKDSAHPDGELYEVVKQIAKNPLVVKVNDPNKTSNTQEADLFVLALGALLQAQAEKEVTIVTEDRKDRHADDRKKLPTKASISSAAGLLCVPDVTMHTYLVGIKYLPRPLSSK